MSWQSKHGKHTPSLLRTQGRPFSGKTGRQRIDILSGTHVIHLKKATGATLEHCLNYVWGQRQNSVCLPLGTDKLVHQTEALTPGADGFIGFLRGLVNFLLGILSLALWLCCALPHQACWFCLSVFHSSTWGRRQCYTSCAPVYLTGSDSFLAKKSSLLPADDTRTKPGDCVFSYLLSFLILTFCRRTEL